MHPSSYNIYIELEKSPGYNFIINGHTGALDLIKKDISKALKCKHLGKISTDTIEVLKKRGYLTEKSVSEERNYIKTILETVNKKRKDQKSSSFVFIVTNNCNFRCPYCFENEWSGKGEKWTKSTFTKEMVDRVYSAMLEIEPDRNKHSDNIYLYGGEPLLKENYEIVKYILSQGKKRNYKFYAISNGYNLDAYIDLLGIGKIEGVQITVDGLEENHNKRRPHHKNIDSFSKIIKNIELVNNTGVAVSVRINGDKTNIDDIEKLVTFFKEKGWYDKYNFKTTPATTYRNCTSFDNAEKSYSRKIFTEQIIKLKESNFNIAKNVADITGIGKLLDKAIKNDEYLEFKPFFCGAVHGMRIFDPDGNMYSCWETIGLKEHKIGTYKNGITYTDSCEKWDNRIVSRIEQCSKCPYSLICAGGCPGKLASVGKNIYQSNCEEFPKIFEKMVNHYFNMELINSI